VAQPHTDGDVDVGQEPRQLFGQIAVGQKRLGGADSVK
jgi:hypothetical protein